MIFTGLKDENGNVIPVQGAGTVYDEQKNSLALGKDTVAIGQDQLVFGRKNVQDANKVEIVGGGGRYLDYLNDLPVGSSYTIANPTTAIKFTATPYSIDFTPTSATFTKVADGKEDIETALLSIYEASTMKPEGLFDQWATGKTGLHAFAVVFYGENSASDSYDGLFLTDGSGNDYWVAYKLGIDSQDRLNANVISQQTVSGGLKNSFSKNIRTLDWQGTQWNAGDITCDDGNGNTISMRDLLSRIATLEASAAES